MKMLFSLIRLSLTWLIIYYVYEGARWAVALSIFLIFIYIEINSWLFLEETARKFSAKFANLVRKFDK